MKQYEMMVIIDPEIGTDAIEESIKEIKSAIKSHKGEITFEDFWGVRNLAYKIKNRDLGYYAVLNFSSEGDNLNELNTAMILENTVLRHMILSLPAEFKPQSLAHIDHTKEDSSKETKEETKKPFKPNEAPVRKSVKAESVKESKPEVKKEEKSLEEVDAKLASIIDNPDLNF